MLGTGLGGGKGVGVGVGVGVTTGGCDTVGVPDTEVELLSSVGDEGLVTDDWSGVRQPDNKKAVM